MAIAIYLLLVLLTYSNFVQGYFNLEKHDDCFCQLQGKIDECSCNIDTVDHFNNVKIYPRLKSLLVKDYFRFYRVNLNRACPFWNGDDSRCAMRYCHVESCEEATIPEGIKGRPKLTPSCLEAERSTTNTSRNLDYLNTTLSIKAKEDLILWEAYDNNQDNNFCVIDENEEGAEYVDLLLNPERYTGYKGQSAQRIWNTIYLENCFRPKKTFNYNIYIQTAKLNELCLEERVFYRAISGLHASINIHLSAQYLLTNQLSLTSPKGVWGPNLDEFKRRFSPEDTNGEGPNWLRNLYFIYLLEIRALAKAAPFLEREEYYTGNEAEDWDTQMAIKDLLNVVRQFPEHFDESSMFANSDSYFADKLKYEFKQHFRNVTRIMDCVGCDKCKLWGKLQTQGLGTALKILFSGQFDDERNFYRKDFQLHRNEIVSLVNAIGRLSTSIYKLDDFRQMLR